MDVEISGLKLEEVDTLLEWVTEEDWNVTMADQMAMVKAYPQHYFAARLNGKFVGCISGVYLGDSMGVLGTFIVDKEYRGKGIGRRLMQFMDTHLDLKGDKRNSMLSGKIKLISTYEKYGFKINTWDIIFFSGPPKLNALSLSKEDDKYRILPVNRTLLPQILDYDETLNLVRREKFVENLISKPDSVSMVAMEGGRVVGYGIIQPAYTGHRVAPLYADSSTVARILLRSILSSVSEKVDRLVLDTPSANPHIESIARELGLKEGERLRRMCTLREEKLQTHKVYAVSNTDITIF